MSHPTPDPNTDDAATPLDRLSAGLAGSDVGHALAFLAVASLDLLVAGRHVLGRPLPPNDTKHWLLRARYYAPGWGMPESELVGQFATHPAAILTLAALLLLVGSAVLAAKVWAVLGFLWATVAVYVAARQFASARVALLAFAIASVSHFYVVLVAFGGIPNLIAVGFLTLSIGAMARARRTGRARDRVTFAALLGLGLFSHPPSSPVFVAAIGVSAVVLATARRDGWIAVRTVVDSLLPSALFLGYVVGLWHVFSAYTASPSGQGIAVVLNALTRNEALFVAYAAAVVGVPALLLVHHVRDRYRRDRPSTHALLDRDEVRRRLGNDWYRDRETALLALAWLAGPVLLAVAVTQLPWIQTRLIRVAYFLVAPLAVLMASFILLSAPLLADYGRRAGFRLEAPGLDMRATVTVVLVLALLGPSLGYTLAYSDRSAEFYSPNDEASVLAVVEWIDGQQPFEGTVAGPYDVAPWVKGLTGQGGLTATPGGGYRPDEAGKADAYRQLMAVREDGATPENVAGARETIEAYDVRYVVAPNNWRASRLEALGDRVYETDGYVVIDVGSADREGSAPGDGGDA